jgi:hypothetical protein
MGEQNSYVAMADYINRIIKGGGGEYITSDEAIQEVMDAWMNVLPKTQTEGIRIEGVEKIEGTQFLTNGIKWTVKSVVYSGKSYLFSMYDGGIRTAEVRLNCLPNEKWEYELRYNGSVVDTISRNELRRRTELERRIVRILSTI